MMQPRDGARLAKDAAALFRARQIAGVQTLQSHTAMEARVFRQEHLTHAACTEAFQEAIGSDELREHASEV
jgi:hypothetical protein